MMKIEFKSELMKHQREHLKFHLIHPHSANFSEMGTGKTPIALKYATILRNIGLVNKILVLCPLSVLHTWEIEIEKHTSFSHIELLGTIAEKIALLEQEADIYSISYDSIPGRRTKDHDTYGEILGALLNKQFDLIIPDEVTMIKGYGTLRTRAVTILCDHIPYSLVLSGSPIANNPAEIFNIYRAFDGGKTFGSNFFSFRNHFFRNIGFAFPKWGLKEDMKEELQKRIYNLAVRIRKEECLDLPPKIFSSRFCYLTKQQKQFYVPIVEELIKILELEEGRVKIQNAMIKIVKLSQITSGFLYTDKDVFHFDENPKAQLAIDLIGEIPDEKVIIYCYWKEDVKILSKLLEDKGIVHGTLYGATSQKDRGKIIDSFENGDLRVLVANIGVGGYGLTLISSSTIIYYNLSFKVLDFIQSQDRIHRRGQTKTCLYLPLLMKGTIDEYIYSIIAHKTAIAESIIDGKELKDIMRRFLSEVNTKHN